MSDVKHPMQPIVMDKHGVARFKENKIVTYLLDHGPNDMNSLAHVPFEQNDREQFAQLIGYSVSGYGDLSYASAESVAVADKMCLPENNNKSELELQNEYLRESLTAIKEITTDAITKLFEANVGLDLTDL